MAAQIPLLIGWLLGCCSPSPGFYLLLTSTNLKIPETNPNLHSSFAWMCPTHFPPSFFNGPSDVEIGIEVLWKDVLGMLIPREQLWSTWGGLSAFAGWNGPWKRLSGFRRRQVLKAEWRRAWKEMKYKSYFRGILRKSASVRSDLHFPLYNCFDNVPFKWWDWQRGSVITKNYSNSWLITVENRPRML